MVSVNDRDALVEELTEFYQKLQQLQNLTEAEGKGKASSSDVDKCEALRSELLRESGKFQPIVTKLTGRRSGQIFGLEFDIWAEALRGQWSPTRAMALSMLVDAVNEAIGILQAQPELEKHLGAAASPDLPNVIFDKMQFHPKIVEVSGSLFKSRHYAPAILQAFIAVNSFARQKTGLSLDGKQLMAQAFSETDPVIRLNQLRTQSDKNEQEGFKFLFMGAMVGIRNPKAHDNIVQTDPFRTLEYIGLASLLMKRAQEGKLRRRRKK